jgi:four helix bundle protein
MFGARILKMVRALPRDVAGQMVARQLARSGTSIGANVEEAQGAQSRVDFARKMNIAMSEARETAYWLRLIGEAGLISLNRLRDIGQEADQLVRILTSIVKRSRQHCRKSKMRKPVQDN